MLCASRFEHELPRPVAYPLRKPNQLGLCMPAAQAHSDALRSYWNSRRAHSSCDAFIVVKQVVCEQPCVLARSEERDDWDVRIVVRDVENRSRDIVGLELRAEKTEKKPNVRFEFLGKLRRIGTCVNKLSSSHLTNSPHLPVHLPTHPVRFRPPRH